MSERIEPSISLEEIPVRRMTHITAGNPDWTPTDDQLIDLTKKFQEAELGNGIFATRSGVRVHSVVVEVPTETARAEAAVLKASAAYVASPDNETHLTLRSAVEALQHLRNKFHVVGCAVVQA